MVEQNWPPPEEFADRFARLRRHKELSNAEIAAATGVIPKTVSMWAAGQEPKGAALLKLAELLDVSADYLLHGTPVPAKSREALIAHDKPTRAEQGQGKRKGA